MDTIASWFSPSLDSRLYVDLLWRNTSQYANFTPASRCALGDYGYIEKATGTFIKEGNVFDEFPELRSNTRIVETPENTRVHFASRSNGTAIEMNLEAQASLLVDCEAKWGWECMKDRHAALICKDPVFCEVLYEGRLIEVLTNNPRLHGKALLLKLIKCTSYAMLLTSGKKGKTYIGFKAETALSVPIAVGGAGATVSWQYGSETGAWTTGVYERGEHRYFPLLTLHRISLRNRKVKMRGKAGREVEVTKKVAEATPYFRPWGDLDEDGADLDEGEDEEE